MPHYKDGQEAKVGDIVMGKGYNVPHVIVGRLIEIREGPTCNVTVACVTKNSPCSLPVVYGQGALSIGTVPNVCADKEYGQADHFELLQR